MQPATSMVPPQMAPSGADQQNHHFQYQQSQQSWAMQPNQPQQLPFQYQMQPPQQMYYQQQPPSQAAQQHQYGATTAQPASSDEVRTLWIGNLPYWMDEQYIVNCFPPTCEVISAKIIRNRQTNQPEGYGFIEFSSHAAAERTLQQYNGTLMPNADQNFRLNWASAGSGEKRSDGTPEYNIFVGDLAPDVTDYMLLETFKTHYPSVKSAKVVTDRMTGWTKGYGFVSFGDESEQVRAMAEMNGKFCSSRAMRIGPAANKKNVSYPNTQGTQNEDDPNNTTIFVGGLNESVSDDQLRQAFSPYGQLVHVKIPIGKRCGFVQFSDRHSAEEAIRLMNGTQLGGQTIRLSWGRSPLNKQPQADTNQWNGAYYPYSQGYGSYGYGTAAQDPNMYYGGYTGYANYQQGPPQQ